VRRWVDLEPWERRAELAKVHPRLTEYHLISDGSHVPELAPLIRVQTSTEDQVKVCVRYFGDEQHPQPEERFTLPGGRHLSPPWGRLHRLDGTTDGSFTVKSKAGRRFSSVTDDEANQAAEVYMRNRASFRLRDDGGWLCDARALHARP
jgi:hypothetical protein